MNLIFHFNSLILLLGSYHQAHGQFPGAFQFQPYQQSPYNLNNFRAAAPQIPVSPQFPTKFEHKERPGPYSQDQIGISVQPGQGPVQPGPLSIPGDPRFAYQFNPSQSGIHQRFGSQFRSSISGEFEPSPSVPHFLPDSRPLSTSQEQIGQPGHLRFAYQFENSAPQYNFRTASPQIPASPQFPTKFEHKETPGPYSQEQIGISVQPGQGPVQPVPLSIPGHPRFGYQFEPLPVQPGYSQRFSNQFLQNGVPMVRNSNQVSNQPGDQNVFAPPGPLITSVNVQLEEFNKLSEEVTKQIKEMMKNQSIPSVNVQQPLVGLQSRIPFQQNQRFYRSPADLQALKAQGYQIFKLQDYKNFEGGRGSGARVVIPGVNLRSSQQTFDHSSNGSQVASNSSVDKDFEMGSQAASSSDDYVVGSPLEACIDFFTKDQHHSKEQMEKVNLQCQFLVIKEKLQKLGETTQDSSDVPLTSQSENSTVTNILRPAVNSNQTQPGQLKSGTKRFGENYINLSEELIKTRNVSSTPVKYYRVTANGNPEQVIPLSGTTPSKPVPISTPNINNYKPLIAGRALYHPNLLPRYAAYNNNNYQLSLMNSALGNGNPITPTANILQNPLYRSANYYY